MSTHRLYLECCRWCLANNSQMTNLFDANLPEIVNNIISLTITKGDSYPQQACKRCILKLSSAYNFRMMALRNHIILTESLQAVSLCEKSGIEHSAEDGNKISSSDFMEHDEEAEPIHLCPVASLAVAPDDANIQREKPDLKSICFDAVTSNPDNFNSPVPLGHQNPSLTKEVKGESFTKNDTQDSGEWPIDTDGSEVKKYKVISERNLRTHQHVKVERNGENCLCTFCGKGFKWKTSLHKHLRVHTGRMKVCYLCDKAFTSTSYLKTHMLTHKPEPKPFSCPQCSASFTQVSSLNRHKLKRCVNAPRQSIGEFVELFVKNENLKLFQVQRQDSPKKEDVEDTKEVLKATQQDHDYYQLVLYNCDICQSKFTQHEHLQTHVDKDHKSTVWPPFDPL